MDHGIRTVDSRDSMKDVVRSSVKVPEFEKHLKKARGHIGRNVVEITIKMKTILIIFISADPIYFFLKFASSNKEIMSNC